MAQIAENDEVLWAFDAFNKAHFLKLTGPSTATAGVPFQVTVTDGSTGVVISGASVGGVLTDSNGQATLTLTSTTKLKASKSDSIRSNSLSVVVS